jgi:hypothetical protein
VETLGEEPGGGEQDEAGAEDGPEAKEVRTADGGDWRRSRRDIRRQYGELRGEAGRLGGLDGLDLGDEAVADGWDCLDETGLAAVVVKCPAKQTDGAGEGAFGDGGVPPDTIQELLLADDAASVLDEEEKEAESLGFKRDGHTVRGEAEDGVIGLKAIEAVDHR